jgi:hypothetical protein
MWKTSQVVIGAVMICVAAPLAAQGAPGRADSIAVLRTVADHYARAQAATDSVQRKRCATAKDLFCQGWSQLGPLVWFLATDHDAALAVHAAPSGTPMVMRHGGKLPPCRGSVPGEATGNLVQLELSFAAKDSAAVRVRTTCRPGLAGVSKETFGGLVTYEVVRRAGTWAVLSARALAW